MSGKEAQGKWPVAGLNSHLRYTEYPLGGRGGNTSPLPEYVLLIKSIMIIYKKIKPLGIGEILRNRDIKVMRGNEWQIRAFEVAEKMGVSFKGETKKMTAGWLQLFKRAYLKGQIGKLDRCYSFVSDYPKELSGEAKIRLFFWKFARI